MPRDLEGFLAASAARPDARYRPETVAGSLLARGQRLASLCRYSRAFAGPSARRLVVVVSGR
jgi:hypothetical protein